MIVDLTRSSRLLSVLHDYYRFRAVLQRRRRHNRAAEAQRAAFYENLWREAAGEVDAAFRPLGRGFFEIRRDDRKIWVQGNWTPLDNPVTSFLCGTKPLMYRLLAEKGLPVPRHVVFTLQSMDQAVAFLGKASVECVVKPAAGAQAGQGVTTGITNRGQLARAAASAGGYWDECLLEEQAAGDNYRLLYLDGRLLDAVMRKPPSIVADGKRSIATLIDDANAHRLAWGADRCPPVLTVDLDMRRTLAKSRLSLRSVPPAGAVIPLKTVINQNLAEENLSAAHLLSDALIDDGARAAVTSGARLAGVDIITSNPGVSLAQAQGVILEVNTPPGYHHHYNKPDGSFPVAARVLNCLLDVEARSRTSGRGQAARYS